jgi:Ca2+-binding RTX toxin-like protein
MANVTAQEQLMLELINRARLEPLAEAARLGIDLNQGLSPGTLNGASKQPLAMSEALVAASRQHSQWMLDTDTFSHTGAGGSSAGQRMTASGYAFTGNWTWGENISWTGTTGAINLGSAIMQQHDGLFRSSGHRTNILSDGFREIGVGQVRGAYQIYDASMVTQSFARSGEALFVTGVVYVDSANDDRYGLGEGTGGVGISVGSAADVSSASGGYEIAFSGGAAAVMLGSVSLQLGATTRNVKLDLVNGDEVWSSASFTHHGGARALHLLSGDALTITGSPFAEQIVGNGGANTLLGQAGDDRIDARPGDDVVSGGDGQDTVTGGDGADRVSGDAGNDWVFGWNGADNVFGGAGDDLANGDDGDDGVFGEDGADIVQGGAGTDVVSGGAGRDELFGGPGADRFLFFATSDSRPGEADSIRDFFGGGGGFAGDRIDVSFIDANTAQAGDQAFSFVGVQGGPSGIGTLQVGVIPGVGVFLFGYTDGDANADLIIDVGLAGFGMGAGNFIL